MLKITVVMAVLLYKGALVLYAYALVKGLASYDMKKFSPPYLFISLPFLKSFLPPTYNITTNYGLHLCII